MKIKKINEKIWPSGKVEIFQRKEGEMTWVKIGEEHNLITNAGFQAIGNHLGGNGAYSATTFKYFAWGDGTTAPAVTRTAADFYSDCANSDTKLVALVNTFDVATKTQQWDCYLSSSDNAVATIKKFALMNADPGTIMFNEVLFSTPYSKDSTINLYFKYTLTLSQA